MKRDHVSFDVFDTCLIRRCGLPSKIWDLMADRLFNKDDDRGRLSFVGNRSLAENKAARRSSYPTLSDIYDELDVAQWGFEKKQVMNLEMEIEEQELFPNPEMLKVVEDYREKGFVIAFISDMYLPMEFIKKILMKFGFCKECERIFVSAECKAGKYDGKLFDDVLKETGVKAKRWIHYGDNERSDYRIPKAKGIKVNLVKNTDFTCEEKRWIDAARFYERKHEIELWAGLCRLARVQNEKSFALTMAVDFIASVYVPYVLWVLRVAKAKGIKTLYFLARDSHIFLEIARTLKSKSEGIECRYLKVNRRTIYPCVFFDVNENEMKMTLGNAEGQTVENALQMLGILWEEVSSETKKSFPLGTRLNSIFKLKELQKSLIQNDASLIRNKSQVNRELLLNYLDQENALNAKVAFVDLGWMRSCQSALNYVLNKNHFQSIPFFYWGYNKCLMYGRDNGDLFVFNNLTDMCSDYLCSNLFLEQYASLNDSGTTIGYLDRGGWITPVERAPDKSAQYLVRINEHAQKEMARSVLNLAFFSDSALKEIFLCCGLKQLDLIQKKPSKKMLRFFSNIRVENYGIESKLVRKLSLKDFIALLVWGVPASMIWTEAATLKSFGILAPLFMRCYKCVSKTFVANKLRLWWEKRM